MTRARVSSRATASLLQPLQRRPESLRAFDALRGLPRVPCIVGPGRLPRVGGPCCGDPRGGEHRAVVLSESERCARRPLAGRRVAADHVTVRPTQRSRLRASATGVAHDHVPSSSTSGSAVGHERRDALPSGALVRPTGRRLRLRKATRSDESRSTITPATPSYPDPDRRPQARPTTSCPTAVPIARAYPPTTSVSLPLRQPSGHLWHPAATAVVADPSRRVTAGRVGSDLVGRTVSTRRIPRCQGGADGGPSNVTCAESAQHAPGRLEPDRVPSALRRMRPLSGGQVLWGRRCGRHRRRQQRRR